MTIRHRVTSDPDCGLKDLGIVFGMRSYGLAVAHKFKYKELFDQVTLHLIESGEIDALEEKYACTSCTLLKLTFLALIFKVHM